MRARLPSIAATRLPAGATIVLAGLVWCASSVAVTPDPSFGGDGTVTTGFGRTAIRYAEANAGAAQADGKVIAAGRAGEATQDIKDGDVALARFLPDGAVDTAFGSQGLVVTDLGPGSSAEAVEVAPDGKIVVAGETDDEAEPQPFLLRYDASGNLDPSFDDDGVVRPPGPGAAEAVALYGDGRILVRAAGAVHRYEAGGDLDPSFGGDGSADVQATGVAFISSQGAGFGEVKLQADGKILTAGPAGIARLNPDGSPDAGFASGGLLDLSTVGLQAMQAMEPQADGQILIAARPRGGGTAVMARITQAGALDPFFGDQGVAGIEDRVTGRFNVTDLAVKADGRVQVVGSGRSPAVSVQQLPDGSIDELFLDRTGAGGVDALVQQPNGLVVGVGFAGQEAAGISAVRYLPFGAADRSFGNRGTTIVLAPGPESNDWINEIVQQRDGKLIAVGFSDTADRGDHVALARFQSDGTLDGTFGSDGRVATKSRFSFRGHGGVAAAVQDDARVIVGVASDGFRLYRYTAAGSLDESFGESGRVRTRFGSDTYRSRITDVALQGKKVLAAGVAFGEAPKPGLFLVRYKSDGEIDEEFGNGGFVRAPFGTEGVVRGGQIAVLGNGSIVAAASVRFGDREKPTRFALTRLSRDGSVHRDFGSAGRAISGFGEASVIAQGIAIAADGKIVVAGGYQNELPTKTEVGFAAARYLPDGTLDREFSRDGRATVGFDEVEARAWGMDVQTGGKVVIVGDETRTVCFDTGCVTQGTALLARFDQSGELDPGFDDDGRASISLEGSPLSSLRSVLALPGDLLIVGGQAVGEGSSPSHANGDFALARLAG